MDDKDASLHGTCAQTRGLKLSDPQFIDLVITPVIVGVGTALFLWYFRNRSGMGIFRSPVTCAAVGLIIGVANYLWKASI